MENQNNQQRVQQLEAVASHYTAAADALRNNNEEACVKHIQQALEAAQMVSQITSDTLKNREEK